MEASSSSSSHFTPASSSRSYNYDVFLSFRGGDTRKKFVGHLSEALKHHIIKVYKDDETLPRGESIAPSLFKAIEESRIAIVIISENYADSSWCLDELAHIMKCRVERGLIVMPIFYDVDPSDVRKQKGDFGIAFAKQEVQNVDRVELWRKSLVDVSNIAGWEPKNIANGQESEFIKKIVDTVFDSLFPLKSNVDEALVGMRARVQELELQLDIESDDVRMIGIWGVGGSGKTTLATSAYMKICHRFQGHCIIGSVRKETSKLGLKKLQEDMLSAIFKREVKVHNVTQGKLMLKNMLCGRRIFVLLDDVDDLDQLEALAGSHDWFGSGSRILITTRDEHLLRAHKVKHICPVRLLSREESFRLFKACAYNQVDPIDDYEKLSLRVVAYSAGLPLALKVLGSFLYDKSKKVWMSTLVRLQDIPHKDIMKILRISYDALDTVEKELFLDIACFWRRKRKDEAMEIFEACDFHPETGIEVLRQKSLISIVDGSFEMHDLVQEMGHHIVRGDHRKSPEKHSRVWKNEEINNMCFGDATQQNDMIEAIEYEGYDHAHSSRFIKYVSSMKKLRYLSASTKGYGHDDHNSLEFVPNGKGLRPPGGGIRDGMDDGGPNFLSNELRYIDWKGYPSSSFPNSFHPMKLVVLKLKYSLQEQLWKDCKHLPHLKVLVLEEMKKLHITPDFNGLPSLQKLTLDNCDELEEIHSSLGNHTTLEHVRISRCHKLSLFPRTLKMDNLKELHLTSNSFSRLDFSLTELTQLKLLNLSDCKKLRELPEIPSSLEILQADYCTSLTTVVNCHKNCKWLSQVSLMGGDIIEDGQRLLNSMLHQEIVIENDSMLLLLQGLRIPERFRPFLSKGDTCTMQLPHKWSDEFCGFLICAVLPSTSEWNSFATIHRAQRTGIKRRPSWKQCDDDKYTFIWYVSFRSIKQTWLGSGLHEIRYKGCTGIGVKLVPWSGSGLQEAFFSNNSFSSLNLNLPSDHTQGTPFSYQGPYQTDPSWRLNGLLLPYHSMDPLFPFHGPYETNPAGNGPYKTNPAWGVNGLSLPNHSMDPFFPFLGPYETNSAGDWRHETNPAWGVNGLPPGYPHNDGLWDAEVVKNSFPYRPRVRVLRFFPYSSQVNVVDSTALSLIISFNLKKSVDVNFTLMLYTHTIYNLGI